MKKASIFIVVLTFIIAIGCKGEKKETESTVEDAIENSEILTEAAELEVMHASVILEAKSGSVVSGIVAFTQEGDMVSMIASISGLSAGSHAIHLHEKADCSSDDGTSSGGHWNPTAQPHGKWGAAEGYHLGDIGNFEADANGNGSVTFSTDQWCIGCGDANKDILGKAVIVHQGIDDFKSQPSGDAGSRVSCGGVIQ